MAAEVVIHRKRLATIHSKKGEYLPYTAEDIAERQRAAELEKQFTYEEFMPEAHVPCEVDPDKMRAMIIKMLSTGNFDIPSHSREFHIMPKRMDLYHLYIKLVKTEGFPRSLEFEDAMRSIKGRSDSGVLVFTLLMSDKPLGKNFTCKWNCHYCPNVPNMARSYIPGEPAVARGDQFNWDPAAQIINRFKAYLATGQIEILPEISPDGTAHKYIPKGEFILEGGTFSSYPEEYCDRFMTELYHSCNTIYDSYPRREPLSLEEEMKINVDCVGIRVVGLSIETRPDMINAKLLKRLRRYGVTRVQIGVQHTNDEILRGVNRMCYDRHTRAAMRMLADNGFKVQIHIMPDLPGSSPEIDIAMFKQLFSDPGYLFDCLKCYPTMVVNFTKIKEWYDAGTYKPYGDDPEKMMNVLVEMTRILNENELKRTRIERMMRDMPENDIEGGIGSTNLGDILAKRCKQLGFSCCCIRCREVRGRPAVNEPQLIRSDRQSAGANEVFLSMEADDMVYGFLRLRLPVRDDPDSQCVFDELNNTALIRELHVYGTSVSVGAKTSHVQSRGFGSKLIEEAKRIAKDAGFDKIAVISGNGVKSYYAKRGFVDLHNYMVCRI